MIETKNEINRQIFFYYMYSALVGTWFASGIWLFFTRRYLSNASIGILDAVCFGVGMLAEIPAGAVADKIGRRKTVIAGILLMGIGYSIWGLALSGWLIFAGILIHSIGGSLQSGADEAMMYDYLKSMQQEHTWPRVSANRYIIARISYIVSIFIGGYLFIFYDRLPFLMRGLTFFLMLIPLLKLYKVDKAEHFFNLGSSSFSGFWSQLITGTRQLFYIKIAWIVPLYIFVQGVSYTVFTAGLLRPLLYEHSGLAIKHHSTAISIALIFNVLVLMIMKRFQNKAYSIVVVYITATICFIGFALNLSSSLTMALTGLTIVQTASYVLMPMLSVQLNKNIDSACRATSLSAASFMENIIYVICAPVVGLLAEKNQLDLLIRGTLIVVFFGLVTSLILVCFRGNKDTNNLEKYKL